MVTPQKFKMVCGESNAINEKKIEKKNRLLLVRSEKIMIKLEVK